MMEFGVYADHGEMCSEGMLEILLGDDLFSTALFLGLGPLPDDVQTRPFLYPIASNDPHVTD